VAVRRARGHGAERRGGDHLPAGAARRRRPDGAPRELIEEYTERYANPYNAAERGYIDDVIDPAETRSKLIAGLAMLRSKREELPKRKHGNVPL
jgi:acetyl-CoA carboxylase carboxyltransferase component